MITLEKPLTPAEQELVVALLTQAREFMGQTMLDSRKVAVWHRYVDAFMFDKPGDDPAARYDAPHRVEHRKFVDRLFRPRPRKSSHD